MEAASVWAWILSYKLGASSLEDFSLYQDEGPNKMMLLAEL